ncbi:hypothetical protein AM1_F0087 (plasmid) [Acaryochloris marina MBIC11017]|uniref:Uncharacterized protein n=1 Tax=Acaryochloris marina (strain MBIC 11017) TaxID=329726 RepID=A8ZQ68_ACAM1|nr:hypothetical protein AM1_F0087 [Acaryochloris marina MBIC11017]
MAISPTSIRGMVLKKGFWVTLPSQNKSLIIDDWRSTSSQSGQTALWNRL